MRCFFDFEFTGLRQDTTPISLGIISEDGHTFYAEFTDYSAVQVEQWHRDNVFPLLRFKNVIGEVRPRIDNEHHAMRSNRQTVGWDVATWLGQWEQVEFWGDCLAYDWVLFCQLFGGGAECLPRNVYYIPFDLATLFKLAGIDPDIDRVSYANPDAQDSGEKHNALFDAKVQRLCYFRAMTLLENNQG